MKLTAALVVALTIGAAFSSAWAARVVDGLVPSASLPKEPSANVAMSAAAAVARMEATFTRDLFIGRPILPSFGLSQSRIGGGAAVAPPPGDCPVGS